MFIYRTYFEVTFYTVKTNIILVVVICFGPEKTVLKKKSSQNPEISNV